MPDSIPPDVALRTLQDGNARFVAGRREHPHAFLTRAYETALAGQRPVAAILACSDSRVPLEIIFDQGLGDIFAIRVAGNICGPSELGSIEFAVKVTGTQLCVILGHTQCGAVTAALDGEKHHDNIDELIAAIEPAIERATRSCNNVIPPQFLDICCRENVFLQMESLFRQSRVVREAIRQKQLVVVGALYDIEWGTATFLDTPHHVEVFLRETDESPPAMHA